MILSALLPDANAEDVTYASHSVEYTWTTHTYAHAWFAGQVSIGSGCIHRSLFIAKTDKTHAKVDAFLTNVNHG